MPEILAKFKSFHKYLWLNGNVSDRASTVEIPRCGQRRKKLASVKWRAVEGLLFGYYLVLRPIRLRRRGYSACPTTLERGENSRRARLGTAALFVR